MEISIRNIIFVCALLVGTYSVFGQDKTTEPVGKSDDKDQVYEFFDYGMCCWIPNYFSPNRDGYSDEWCLKTSGVTSCSIVVVNRWGNIILDKQFNNVIEDETFCVWSNGIGDDDPCVEGAPYNFIIDLSNAMGQTQRIGGALEVVDPEPCF